jgi:hypothetical protein
VRLYDAQTDAASAAVAFIESVLDDLGENDLLQGRNGIISRKRVRIAREQP